MGAKPGQKCPGFRLERGKARPLAKTAAGT